MVGLCWSRSTRRNSDNTAKNDSRWSRYRQHAKLYLPGSADRRKRSVGCSPTETALHPNRDRPFPAVLQVRYTGNVNNSTFRLETRDQTGSSAFFGAIRDNRLPNVSDVNEKYLCAIGPWSNATGIDYVELWVSYASAYNAQFLANTSITLEVI